MSLLPPFIGHCCLCRRPRVTVVAIAGTAARASLSPRKAAGVLPRYATGELKQPATWHSQRNFEAKKVLPLSSQRAGCKIEGRKTSTGAVEVTVSDGIHPQLGGSRDKHKSPSLATGDVNGPEADGELAHEGHEKWHSPLRDISIVKLERN